MIENPSSCSYIRKLTGEGLKARSKTLALGIFVAVVCLFGCIARAEEPTAASLFAESGFDRWAEQGPIQQIPFKLHTLSHGLSLHQRIVAHVEVEIAGRELVERANHGQLVALVRVTDQQGHDARDFGIIELKEAKPELRKQTWTSTWEAFALPGEYRITVALYDKVSGEHSLQETRLRVQGLKNDPLPQMWDGIPAWEFWAPLTDLQDEIYRSDVDTPLHLAIRNKQRLKVEVLADLTPSDLFHGSSRFYERYLSVALPLMKALSQLEVENGSIDVEAVDLRQRRVTFQQTAVKKLDWPAMKKVLAPENGPSAVDAKSLGEKHQSPDFLRDELLALLRQPGKEDSAGTPAFKLFIVLGSPMDFYAFHHFPAIDAAQAENCVVYYLQFETYGGYADGALSKVKDMLKPLPIHTIKVRSADSVRHALSRIVNEASAM